MSKSELPSNKEKRKEIFELISHLCVGLSIFMKGVDKLEHPGKEFIAAVLLIAGLSVIAFSIFHKKFKPQIGHIKAFIFGVEGIVMALIGYSFMTEGSHTIHYAYFIVSILFFAAVFIYLKNKASSEKKHIVSDPELNKSVGNTNSIASDEKNI